MATGTWTCRRASDNYREGKRVEQPHPTTKLQEDTEHPPFGPQQASVNFRSLPKGL